MSLHDVIVQRKHNTFAGNLGKIIEFVDALADTVLVDERCSFRHMEFIVKIENNCIMFGSGFIHSDDCIESKCFIIEGNDQWQCYFGANDPVLRFTFGWANSK